MAQNTTQLSDDDRDLLCTIRTTDPRDDKRRIEDTKGGLLRNSYHWILENVDVVMRRFGHPHQEYQIVTKLGKTVTQGQEQSHWKSYVLNAANGAPGVQGKSFANHSGTLGALMELYLETCKKLDELLDDKTRGQFGNVGYFK